MGAATMPGTPAIASITAIYTIISLMQMLICGRAHVPKQNISR